MLTCPLQNIYISPTSFSFPLYVRAEGSPIAACQLVLKYMLMNRRAFVKAFHNRVYFFSSGTKFMQVSTTLSKWIEKHEEARIKHVKDNATVRQ